ncbi:leucine-rich repeat, immunoglobulin-like domain and transmembrane domain-containing protein 1 [Xenopus laevis]|uniref:LRRCT domain-containing protein n=1 Tax=Xenopus laevis TaxID=8355 RepID=A0A974D4D8_XENLA|nr:leucine-rich repeat, immunoglobulin-like domain and transmembrane domain-containing protein 1 [Xenopus laevis]XP_018113835.1 leucine-rich repeat, immunoglobulin-like domain and transmembrane domain-containing protein 1 [Xenopus laevis]OCT84928.1 hypothetical protein XELAEV_18023088mg [Xenopus laevis]
MSDHQCARIGLLWLIVLGTLAKGIADSSCNCINLKSLSDWPALDSEPCCLNLSLSVDTIDWNNFTTISSLRVLDLSYSGIKKITDLEEGRKLTNIEKLYIDHNHLKELPGGFLSNAPNLRVLNLGYNQLGHLPTNFLRVSNNIEEIDLSYNNLTSISPFIIRSSLSELGFQNNSLECTCALYDLLEPTFHGNNVSRVLEELICSSPRDVIGLQIINVRRNNICRSHSLTVVIICIPLILVLGLMCWYVCCRRQKGSYSKTRRECSLATVDRNGAGNMGDYHHYEPRQQFIKDRREIDVNQLNDPILLKPSAALLGSSRDLYEEVEIKLGTSSEPLVEGEGHINRDSHGLMLAVEGEDDIDRKAGDELEVETVSVTEVMKDSTDREKFYLNQSTDYYSLVPGIELEDSDHCEYESVDLS